MEENPKQEWSERFDRMFPILTVSENTEEAARGSLNVVTQTVKSFIQTVEKEAEERRRLRAMKFAQSVIDSDKTRRYGYSRHPRDKNNRDEFAGQGQRWLTPEELAINFRDEIILEPRSSKESEV